MEKSLEQLRLIERISRQTRHHRTHLNKVYNEKLHEELNNLSDKYEQTFLRLQIHQKLEQKRKQALGITIQQIANERQRSSLSTNSTDNENRPLSSIKQSPNRISCRLFSHDCQLYPCQPIYHYTSFIKKEHDQTLQQRNLSPKNSNIRSNSSFSNIQKNRRDLSITDYTQHYLANRHAYMKDTKARLDGQSRLLHERLAEKKIFGSVKDHQYELKQAIKHHLTISAKFCS